MRIFKNVGIILLMGLLQARAEPAQQAVVHLNPTPLEAFQSGTRAYVAGEKSRAFKELMFAAEKGHTLAQWKLARMYARGDGVERDDRKAFEYYSRIAETHADDHPGGAQARFVSNAFVELGFYHLRGIEDSTIRPDALKARQMLTYAATYFGDAEAQYQLGRMYLESIGVKEDARQAARWLSLAANKGHYRSQIVLGKLLMQGEKLPRQPARALMWLALAREHVPPSEEMWVSVLQANAISAATEQERGLAQAMLDNWSSERRN